MSKIHYVVWLLGRHATPVLHLTWKHCIGCQSSLGFNLKPYCSHTKPLILGPRSIFNIYCTNMSSRATRMPNLNIKLLATLYFYSRKHTSKAQLEKKLLKSGTSIVELSAVGVANSPISWVLQRTVEEFVFWECFSYLIRFHDLNPMSVYSWWWTLY